MSTLLLWWYRHEIAWHSVDLYLASHREDREAIDHAMDKIFFCRTQIDLLPIRHLEFNDPRAAKITDLERIRHAIERVLRAISHRLRRSRVDETPIGSDRRSLRDRQAVGFR